MGGGYKPENLEGEEDELLSGEGRRNYQSLIGETAVDRTIGTVRHRLCRKYVESVQ